MNMVALFIPLPTPTATQEYVDGPAIQNQNSLLEGFWVMVKVKLLDDPSLYMYVAALEADVGAGVLEVVVVD